MKEFNNEEQIDRMFYDIKKDKPAFRPYIDKDDLYRVVCVRAKLDNVRIAQER